MKRLKNISYKSGLLKVGEKAILKTAHLFVDGYWSSYSDTEVDVLELNGKTIELRNSKYPNTRYSVTEKNLQVGFMDINPINS